MTSQTLQQKVISQFGEQATAYLTSTVHASGEDLKQLESLVQDRDEACALDMGCGGGHVAFTVAPHLRAVTAYDLSSNMLAVVGAEAARRGLPNLTCKQGAAELLPFADRSFDFVFSRYSAHHWRDLVAGLREARRVLKDQGQAVFMDVVSSGPPLPDTFLQSIELLRDPSHVRDYAIGEWCRMLEGAGFRLVNIVTRRLPLDFASWVARINTPPAHVAALRSLLANAPIEIARSFEIQADGSFCIDTASFEVVAAG